MEDDFEGFAGSLNMPAVAADAVVPNDTATLPHVTRALYVGVAGNVAVEMLSGDTVVLSGAQAGAVYPFRVSKVLATGTTAGGLVALR
ncbi:MAG: hypothetical protein KJN93_00360 [Alphaproteobacteria bacterium]|nr:hypothetical protein [Alphaproteobacteria bacterium]